MVYRFSLDKFEELIRLTEFCTWEELPIKDPATGLRTFSGLITTIQNISKNIFTFTLLFQMAQASVRIVTSHDMVYDAWYPFDASTSPAYELTMLSQVKY
jgi:hypothetical protein